VDHRGFRHAQRWRAMESIKPPAHNLIMCLVVVIDAHLPQLRLFHSWPADTLFSKKPPLKRCSSEGRLVALARERSAQGNPFGVQVFNMFCVKQQLDEESTTSASETFLDGWKRVVWGWAVRVVT